MEAIARGPNVLRGRLLVQRGGDLDFGNQAGDAGRPAFIKHTDERTRAPRHFEVALRENLRGADKLGGGGERKSPIDRLSELGWTVRPGISGGGG